MGRATINSESGAGLYTVDFDYGQAEADALAAKLSDRKAELEAYITAQEIVVTNNNAVVAQKTVLLNSAIDTYNASEKTKEDEDKVDAATEALAAAREAAKESTSKLNAAKIDLTNTNARLNYIQGAILTSTQSTWCVDYTELATGAVATIEVNAEQPLKLIAPGAPSPGPADGVFKSRKVQSAEQVYLNAAILPGWQKFSPTYRVGAITSIDRANDTCNVTLDPANSSAQNLGINQAGTLSDVPIEYMTCNANAFAVGDDVVVKFEGQDWANPKVIGFKSNPKVCAPSKLFFLIEIHDVIQYSGNPQVWPIFKSDVTTTNPATGDVIIEAIYEKYDDPGDSSIGFVTEDPDHFHANLRIRFDIMWLKWETEELWRPPTFNEIYSIDHGAAPVIIAPTGPTSQTFNYVNEEFKWFYNDITGNEPPDEPSYATGTSYDESYRMAYWPLDQWPIVPNDRSHADLWFRGKYESLPASIDVTIQPGVVETYVLETIGSPPDYISLDERQVPTQEPIGPAFPYTTTGWQSIGAIYRLQ